MCGRYALFRWSAELTALPGFPPAQQPHWNLLPNGRVLMFFREAPGVAPKLWTVDISGRVVRPAPYSGSGSDPAWSPLLN